MVRRPSARLPGGHPPDPSNRGRSAFREAVAAFYKRRFGVDLDPETEVLPLLGGKEGVAHICWSMLDPGATPLADPGYPV